MTRYGQPVDVRDSEMSCEPDPRQTLLDGQYGWAFYPMRDDQPQIQPRRLLDVQARSGQIVLIDDDDEVRWSFVIIDDRAGDNTSRYQYAVSANHQSDSIQLTFKQNTRVADGNTQTRDIPAVDILVAAKEGREYLEV